MAEASRLAEALAAAGAKMGTVPKNGKNTFYGYSYATESDIVGAVRVALFECGVAIVPAVTGFDRVPITVMTAKGERATNRCTTHIAFTLIHGESGEQITTPWVGEALDAEDKGLSKCVTNALKYFLRQLFLIETGDLSDEIDKDEDPGKASSVKPTAGSAPEGDPDAWRAGTTAPPPAKPANPTPSPAAKSLASDAQKKFIRDLAKRKITGGVEKLDEWLAKNRTASLDAMSIGAAKAVIGALQGLEDVPAETKAGHEAHESNSAIDATLVRLRDRLVAVENAYPGRRAYLIDNGVWFIVGAAELGVVGIPAGPDARMQLDYLTPEQMMRLGMYLKDECDRRKPQEAAK